MDIEMVSAVWGFIGTVVGAITTLAATWLNNRQGSRQEERRTIDARIEHAREFQRVTLIALQEKINDCAKVCSAMSGDAVVAERNKILRNHELIQQLSNHIGDLHILSGRVAHDDLRILLGKYIVLTTKWLQVDKSVEFQRLLIEVQPHFALAVNSTSDQLRALFEPIPKARTRAGMR